MNEKFSREPVILASLGDRLVGQMYVPNSSFQPCPAVVICHGAGDYKENYFELSEYLVNRGVASLVLDMHGHGGSEGDRYHVNMEQWVADIRAAVDFLQRNARIDGGKIGAFGLSSGGTAILEAALVEHKLRALVALDATVRNSLPLSLTFFLKCLVFLGKIKQFITGKDLRIALAKLSGEMHLASDPEINKRLLANTEGMQAFMSFPFPGAAAAFFVDTLKRVHRLKTPTLVLWGEDDKVDPPASAQMLFQALTCKKQLHIIPGNGHLGHLDRNRQQVFALTTDWLLENLTGSREQEHSREQVVQNG